MDWKKFLKEYKEHFQKAKEEDVESINQIEIDFEKEILVLNGKKVEQAVIVELPHEGEWRKAKVFHSKKRKNAKLPKISIFIENLGNIDKINGNKL